ncbi:MAG: HlyD family efflux transporter periplasmic adaptor subunit, partial [Chromatiales bacterium]|nr:HlyD family efflux transporter periplasmic adaptor subunit [Chromatiales bacterium]
QARAAALRDRAHLDLERTAVRAPFSGPISQVLVAVGARVQPGTALLNLFDSSALELRAQVPTQYIGAVRRALSAGQSISAAGVVEGQPVKATLQRLGAEVGRGSGGVDALFGINYGARDLPLGLTVELTVALAVEHGTFALPPQAIYGARHVYRVNAGRMERVAISRIGETQTASGTRVILRSEMLKSGDQVVSTQLPNAADGLKIKVAS